MRQRTDNTLDIAYQVDEQPPLSKTLGVGLQLACLAASSMILTPALVFRVTGFDENVIVSVVFTTLVICGCIIALHARPIGRFGSGYILAIGPTSAAIAVTVDTLNAGGPSLLAILLITAAGLQFIFALRLSLLRRLITPTVAGTALMLISVTVMPVMFGLYDRVPDGHATEEGVICAGITILIVGGILLTAGPRLRPWAPLIGIVSGSLTALFFGLYDVERVSEADWVGTPNQWPMFFIADLHELDFETYLGLLPAFVLLYLILTIRGMSSSLAIQTVSWRRPRALNFRPVQGAIGSDALSNVAAGLFGTVPNGTTSGIVGRVQLAGVAARQVGLVFGAAIFLLAFFPKAVALVLAIPAPVYAGYVTLSVAATFIVGFKMAIAEGADHRQSLIIGLAFWVGIGCQYGLIFPDFIGSFAGGMLNSALTAGGLLAIALTGLLILTSPRRQRLVIPLDVSSLPALHEFARELGEKRQWAAHMLARVEGVIEESLLTLLGDEDNSSAKNRRLLVLAASDKHAVDLEFVAAAGEENIEDRMALLGESASEATIERDVSLKLLRHLATEIQHRQYYDVDVLTVHVDSLAEHEQAE